MAPLLHPHSLQLKHKSISVNDISDLLAVPSPCVPRTSLTSLQPGVPLPKKWNVIGKEELDLIDPLAGHLDRELQCFVLSVEQLDRKIIKAQEVYFELLSTEQDYLRDLELLIQVFQFYLAQ